MEAAHSPDGIQMISISVQWIGVSDPGQFSTRWTYHRRYRHQGIDVLVYVVGGEAVEGLCAKAREAILDAFKPVDRLERRLAEGER